MHHLTSQWLAILGKCEEPIFKNCNHGLLETVPPSTPKPRVLFPMLVAFQLGTNQILANPIFKLPNHSYSIRLQVNPIFSIQFQLVGLIVYLHQDQPINTTTPQLGKHKQHTYTHFWPRGEEGEQERSLERERKEEESTLVQT